MQEEKVALSAFLHPFFEWLRVVMQGPRWRVKATLVCLACGLLFQFPEYEQLYRTFVTHVQPQPSYAAFQRQVAHPLTNAATAAEASSHEAKMTFRLTVPLLARVLHLNIIGVLVGQFLMGLVMLWALLTLVERSTHDRPTALLLAVGTSFTYYGGAFLHEYICFFDTFGYAVLLLLLLVRRPAVLLILTVVGGFIDERVLLASLLAVLWHGLRRPAEQGLQLRWPAITGAGLAIAAGGLAYGGIRLWLAATYGLKSYSVGPGGVGLSAVYQNLLDQRMALGFVSGLESFWLLPLLALGVLGRQRRWQLALALVLAAGPIIGGSLLVYDLTRSLAYAFPLVLVSVRILASYFTQNSIRHLALLTAVFAVLIPNYYYHGWLLYSESLFEKASRYVLSHFAL